MQQLDRLKEGDLLELVREPDNGYLTSNLHKRKQTFVRIF
jgi:hypothetical protein